MVGIINIMAKVSYVDIVPGLEVNFWQNLTPQDRFVFSRITRKVKLCSVKRKKGLAQRSFLPQIADAWRLLTDEEKQNWTNAGAECDLNGYRLFVQDKTARIINGLSGNATPNLLHQSWVGQLHIEAPAKELKIIQPHPAFYWVYKKVSGRKGMHEPVEVREDFSLPLKIEINYRAALVSAGSNPFAKFFARVFYLYQGQTLEHSLEINFNLVQNWQNRSAILSGLIGLPIRYDLYIWLHDLTGDLYIDNIKAIHSGQNWVRDSYCNDINQGFTKAFFQIPKHWAGVVVPPGSWYESIYKDF